MYFVILRRAQRPALCRSAQTWQNPFQSLPSSEPEAASWQVVPGLTSACSLEGVSLQTLAGAICPSKAASIRCWPHGLCVGQPGWDMAAGGCSPSIVFVVLRLLLEVCCFQWQHVGVPCIFLKISKAQQCLWGKNWEGYWCWVCGLAVTDTCSPLLGGRPGTRLPLCMVALVTMALVKWRCTGKSPQCEDTVSKGAQQRQMKHLLSPQPWKGPSGSPALCGFPRNQDLSLGYFTPQVLHLGSVFTARVRWSFAATAFRLAQEGRPCERCCPQCARCWVRTVQRCRWWGSTSFHRAQSAAVSEWLKCHMF